MRKVDANAICLSRSVYRDLVTANWLRSLQHLRSVRAMMFRSRSEGEGRRGVSDF